MGLNHMAAMLSPEGLKTFVLPHRNSFPNISSRGSGYEIYCLWPIWPLARIRPMNVFLCIMHPWEGRMGNWLVDDSRKDN